MSVLLSGCRTFLYFGAFLLALFPSVIKMYETSHWFREGDPSDYDKAKDWFDNPNLPLQSKFDSSKVLMRVYFFIIPYIFSAALITLAQFIPSQSSTILHKSLPRRTIGSFFRRTITFPSSLVRLGSPYRISVGELLGVAVFLVINIGTMGVRVRRSLPRGSRKILFLVDLIENKRDPIDPYSWQAAEVWAKTLGVISILNLGWYLLMPIGRKSVLLEAIGMSWERAVKYHRWVGYYSVIIMLIHSILYVAIWIHGDGNPNYDPDGKMIESNMVPWYCSNNECDEDQSRILRVNMYGFVTMFLILVMTGFALPWVRRQKFEWFYYVHHLFILVLVFVCLHYKGAIIYLIPGIAIYSIDKLVALSSYKKTAPVAAKMVSDSVLEISFKVGPGVEYKAGDYVFLNVPGVSFLEWHPFSLTSAPAVNGKTAFFHLKDEGSWTKEVIELAKKSTDGTLKVRLDGFYGVTGINEELQSKDGVILVGGGIGITPMVSLAKELYKTSEIPVSLFWIVRTVDEFSIFAREFAEAQRCYDDFTPKVWITLSQPEPGIEKEMEKTSLLEQSHMGQVERIMEALPPSESNDRIKNISSDEIYTITQPGLSGSTNAFAMCISLLVALLIFAWMAEMRREEWLADTVVDKFSMMELCMIFAFLIIWILVIVVILRPAFQPCGGMVKAGKVNKKSFDNTGLSETALMLDNYEQQEDEETKQMPDCDEGVETKLELIDPLIRGHIGCRPDLPQEFAAFAKDTFIQVGENVDIGVLACGPAKMVETINSICNEGMQNKNYSFSFTEEDWEW